MRHGRVDADWIAEQVRFCDNVSGDIDTLSNRIRQVRTWTFVANRRNWLADPGQWRENTRDIEDRLSDALHERLTQRFVDRRTSVLIRHLRDRLMVSPEINERGEVSLEGHLIGTLEGFRFTLAPSQGEADAKGLRTAAEQVVAPQIRHRAERIAGAPNEEFVLATDGFVRWRGEIVAVLVEGDAMFAPRLTILADESLTGPDLERVQERLSLWLRHLVNTQLETVIALAEPPELEGAARGLAFRIYEHLGLLPRATVAEEVKGLEQEVRGKLRKLGVKFGAYHVYVPQSLKPAPRELAIILFALKHGGVRQPGVTELPQVVLSGRTSFEIDPAVNPRLYEIAGFKVAGKRAVRVDILERLADIIRPLVALDAKTHHGDLPAGAAEGNGFRVTVEMTSLLGCSGEDFASILNSLGYRVRRSPKAAIPAPAPEAPAVEATPALEAIPAAAPEGTPVAEPAAEPPATTDATAAAAVEGTVTNVHSAPEAPALSEATADLGAPAPAADAAADAAPESAAPAAGEATPAEPQFDEVWYPVGRRPEGRRPPRRDHRPARAPSVATPAASTNGAGPEPLPEENRRPRPQRGQGRPRPANGRNRDREDAEAGPKPARGNGKSNGHRNDSPRPPRERREPVLDPDSPWAALAALRSPKPE
jgi:ATP-dependent RNA helicase SUPV3L1/SUV3